MKFTVIEEFIKLTNCLGSFTPPIRVVSSDEKGLLGGGLKRSGCYQIYHGWSLQGGLLMPALGGLTTSSCSEVSPAVVGLARSGQ